MHARGWAVRGLLLVGAAGFAQCRDRELEGPPAAEAAPGDLRALTPTANAVSCGTCSPGDRRPCIESQGNCALGEQLCGPGLDWGECSILPLPSDTCESGDDATCNGTPNEGCPCVEGDSQPCGPSATGTCLPGSSRCGADARWGECLGARPPALRDCLSSADNDCNGTADNQESSCPCQPCGTRDCSNAPSNVCRLGTQACSISLDHSTTLWGPCAFTDKPDGTACDDGDPSTLDDECRAGNCRGFVCASPGEFRCSGAFLQRCNAERTGFDTLAECHDLGGFGRAGRPDPDLCDAASGRCLLCVPGSSRCSADVVASSTMAEGCSLHRLIQGATLARCSADGLSETGLSCGAGTAGAHCRGRGSDDESVPDGQCFDQCLPSCFDGSGCAFACNQGHCEYDCCPE